MLTRCYGLAVELPDEAPGAWNPVAPGGPVDVRAHVADGADVASAWSGPRSLGWSGRIEDVAFVCRRGHAGDHLLEHGDARHWLSPDASELRCGGARDVRWWRVVLDAVLSTVALVRGRRALHAATVAWPGRAVAILAGSGGGKSTLAAALLDAGAELVADDVTVLESRGREVVAHAATPTMTVPGEPTGAEVGRWGGERWCAVPTVSVPVPLAAVVELHRGPSTSLRLEHVRSPLRPLSSSMLHFPATEDGARARFMLAADVASSAAVMRLEAPEQTPASVLAELLAAELAR